MLRRLLAVAVVAVLVGAAVACGTDAKGVEACKRIEQVRCESAAACGIDLTKPVHRESSPSGDVGACVRYYEVACLHGLASGVDPGSVAVDACVQAITNGSCDVVKAPETVKECSFLVPTEQAPTDAGTPTTTTTDAGTTTDAAAAGDGG